MKIVVSSDNYLDVNRISPAEALAFQAQYLNQIKADYYLFAGDMFNDFLKTKSYLEELNDLITGQVFFIAGNHDMLKNVTFAQLESPPFRLAIYIIKLMISPIPLGGWLLTMVGMTIVSVPN